jgi:transposase
VKKLSDVLQQAIFDDSDYRLLSDNSPVTLERMKGFERMKEENRGLYNDVAYKVLTADRAIDVGFSEDKLLKNGKAVKANSKACLKQKIIVTFFQKGTGIPAVHPEQPDPTNLDDKPKDILKINESRYKIEDCFRIMKTNFRSRPIYHHKRPRIIAHFMVCYTALLISQLLQNKLDDYGTHFTTEDILETLKNMIIPKDSYNASPLFFVLSEP